MHSRTPRATPAAKLPVLSLGRPQSPARALTAPLSIVTTRQEHELSSGSLLIGRSPDCELLLEDPLVSRYHARVVVQGDGVYVEDLHSTNGVYVNGLRIAHLVRLREGDRILIGTSELSAFSSNSSRSNAPDSSVAKSPSTWPAPKSAEAATKPPPPSRRSRALEDIPPTARVDSLRIIGSLAHRFAAGSRLDEAERVLSAHLKRILQGANAGLEVPEELCRVASQLALDLAGWSSQSVWIDYAVELHLSARHLMSLQLISALESAELWIGAMDRLLLAYYVESLESRSAAFSPDERARLDLLRKLVAR